MVCSQCPYSSGVEPVKMLAAWCAGVGVVGTTAAALAAETASFEHLLLLLRKHLSDVSGQILLASSAGGVYGDNPAQPLTEDSLCRPISDYGRNKLRQERLLLDWASDRPLVSVLIARISNLYGPGQNMDKPQGLIAHISRSLLHHTPVHVYVSLDTLRDYVFASCGASAWWSRPALPSIAHCQDLQRRRDGLHRWNHCRPRANREGTPSHRVRVRLGPVAATRPASIPVHRLERSHSPPQDQSARWHPACSPAHALALPAGAPSTSSTPVTCLALSGVRRLPDTRCEPQSISYGVTAFRLGGPDLWLRDTLGPTGDPVPGDCPPPTRSRRSRIRCARLLVDAQGCLARVLSATPHIAPVTSH